MPVWGDQKIAVIKVCLKLHIRFLFFCFFGCCFWDINQIKNQYTKGEDMTALFSLDSKLEGNKNNPRL